jgi:flagellar protein FlaF
MSLNAYKQATARAETPREMEYRLFGQVTRALMSAAETDPSEIAVRIDAVDWNRRLWTTLANDCSSSGNGLPAGVRASIISLSLWVTRHSSAVMRGDEGFEPLIEVNRMMMSALAPAPEAAAA